MEKMEKGPSQNQNQKERENQPHFLSLTTNCGNTTHLDLNLKSEASNPDFDSKNFLKETHQNLKTKVKSLQSIETTLADQRSTLKDSLTLKSRAIGAIQNQVSISTTGQVNKQVPFLDDIVEKCLSQQEQIRKHEASRRERDRDRDRDRTPDDSTSTTPTDLIIAQNTLIRSPSNWNNLLTTSFTFRPENLKSYSVSANPIKEPTLAHLTETATSKVDMNTLNKSLIDINIQQSISLNNLCQKKWEMQKKSKKERRLKALQKTYQNQETLGSGQSSDLPNGDGMNMQKSENLPNGHGDQMTPNGVSKSEYKGMQEAHRGLNQVPLAAQGTNDFLACQQNEQLLSQKLSTLESNKTKHKELKIQKYTKKFNSTCYSRLADADKCRRYLYRPNKNHSDSNSNSSHKSFNSGSTGIERIFELGNATNLMQGAPKSQNTPKSVASSSDGHSTQGSIAGSAKSSSYKSDNQNQILISPKQEYQTGTSVSHGPPEPEIFDDFLLSQNSAPLQDFFNALYQHSDFTLSLTDSVLTQMSDRCQAHSTQYNTIWENQNLLDKQLINDMREIEQQYIKLKHDNERLLNEYEPIHSSCEMAEPLNNEMVTILSAMQEDIVVLKSTLDNAKKELIDIYGEIKEEIFKNPILKEKAYEEKANEVRDEKMALLEAMEKSRVERMRKEWEEEQEKGKMDEKIEPKTEDKEEFKEEAAMDVLVNPKHEKSKKKR